MADAGGAKRRLVDDQEAVKRVRAVADESGEESSSDESSSSGSSSSDSGGVPRMPDDFSTRLADLLRFIAGERNMLQASAQRPVDLSAALRAYLERRDWRPLYFTAGYAPLLLPEELDRRAPSPTVPFIALRAASYRCAAFIVEQDTNRTYLESLCRDLHTLGTSIDEGDNVFVTCFFIMGYLSLRAHSGDESAAGALMEYMRYLHAAISVWQTSEAGRWPFRVQRVPAPPPPPAPAPKAAPAAAARAVPRVTLRRRAPE